MSLDALGVKYDTDKSSIDHNYLDAYEKVLQSITVKNLLEIGIAGGQSLKMWSEYYPDAKIIGIDINSNFDIMLPNVETLLMNQQNTSRLQILQDFYSFDVIIDDGSHVWGDQMRTFFALFPLMKSGSVYIMEDVHTSYFSSYNDGICNPLIVLRNYAVFKNISEIIETGGDKNSKSLIILRK